MNKLERFGQRRKRTRAKIAGVAKRPRLTVFKSNKAIYAQIIDDDKKITLVSASSLTKEVVEVKGSLTVKAAMAGEIIAKKALAKKINKVVFDKSGYKYHGIVKAVAEGARKGGLEF
jgi:large subunit ribosomal protein L18